MKKINEKHTSSSSFCLILLKKNLVGDVFIRLCLWFISEITNFGERLKWKYKKESKQFYFLKLKKKRNLRKIKEKKKK